MTTKVTFIKGSTESKFLNLLGVPYGLLGVGGYELVLAIDLEASKHILREYMQDGYFANNDEMLALEKAMEEAGLESATAMFDKARQFQIPDDFSPLYHFKPCTTPDCRQPLAHGSLYNANGQLESREVVRTLDNGFNMCEVALKYKPDLKLHVVKVFQEMLAADLAIDGSNWLERYEALPEETRRNYEADTALLVIFGD